MAVNIDLPRLTSAELIARFGSDEAALRRYRMLAALVREGRPASEVARTFGVSRESLRRVRRSFASHGLDGLQSRKRGGGHFARDTALAVALRQELSADPGVAAAALWRRVQARLEASGARAPRSSFYRLLAQLRDEENLSQSDTLVRLLRDALGALAEDPPLELGRSDLAALLLPDVRDPLGRGRTLQRAIRVAVNRLRPAEAGPVLDDPRWRHYLIVAGEYEAGEKRAALQDALALSTSTYSRAKREALERLAAVLPAVAVELPPTDSPATLVAPPAPPDTFEQHAELERYADRLRREGLALIWGPDGSGKIGLAAALAAHLQSRGQTVIWHTCRPPDGPANAGHGLVATLAAALALGGKPDLWNQVGGAEPAPTAGRLDALTEGLRGRHWTIVIANGHWLDGDDAARVVDVLRAARERRDLRLVLVGRDLPEWASRERWPPLPLPDDADGRLALLQSLDGGAGRRPAAPAVALRDRANELLAALQQATAEPLAPDEAERLLAALRPIERAIRELHAATETPQ